MSAPASTGLQLRKYIYVVTHREVRILQSSLRVLYSVGPCPSLLTSISGLFSFMDNTALWRLHYLGLGRENEVSEHTFPSQFKY
jgi:hypothetical protein